MTGGNRPLIGQQWPALTLRAGALPYRLDGGEPEFLLIRRRGQSGWSIPKGRLIAFRAIGETVRLEAYQEAGVHGLVGAEPIGSYIHIKVSKQLGRAADPVEVMVFPLKVAQVESHWPEMDVRERRWMRAADARHLIASDKLCDLVIAFARTLTPSFELDLAAG